MTPPPRHLLHRTVLAAAAVAAAAAGTTVVGLWGLGQTALALLPLSSVQGFLGLILQLSDQSTSQDGVADGLL